MTGFHVIPVLGIGEISHGDDLAEIIGTAANLADGDILVVTSKVVSKAEGNVRVGVDRDEVIDDETVRVVSQWTTPRGRTVIAQTRHGFVMAAAGVDASNVASGSVVLLPADPDASARRLRAALRERFGARVGVVLSDTAGRPWRDGVVDFAVGAAGLVVLDDYRGKTDAHGNDLGVTVVAVADELAAATELVRSKLSGVPAAVVRGLSSFVLDDDGPGVAALIRPAEEDRFRLGTPEAQREVLADWREAQDFTGAPVPETALDDADIAAAASSGREVARFVRLTDPALRIRVLDEIAATWAEHLRRDGASEPAIADRLADDQALRHAPLLVLACVGPDAAPGEEFRAGAAAQNYVLSLGIQGYGARWLRAGITQPEAVAAEVSLNGWRPVQAFAVGIARSRLQADRC